MRQYSNDGSSIELELLSGHLMFIDPLYYQDIIDNADKLNGIPFEDKVQFIQKIEEHYFPYGGGLLVG
jgi:hypothetical protein